MLRTAYLSSTPSTFDSPRSRSRSAARGYMPDVPSSSMTILDLTLPSADTPQRKRTPTNYIPSNSTSASAAVALDDESVHSYTPSHAHAHKRSTSRTWRPDQCSPCSPRCPSRHEAPRRGQKSTGTNTISTFLRAVRRGKSSSMTSEDWSALVREYSSSPSAYTPRSALAAEPTSSPRSKFMSSSKREETSGRIWNRCVLVVFWLAVMVYFSALFGIGAAAELELEREEPVAPSLRIYSPIGLAVPNQPLGVDDGSPARRG